MAGALQPGDRVPHLRRVASVPAVADDRDGCAVAEHTAGVPSIEGLDRLTDTRSTRPVVDRRHHPVERRIDVVAAEHTCDAGEARREDEHLDARAGALHRVREVEEQAGGAPPPTAAIAAPPEPSP